MRLRKDGRRLELPPIRDATDIPPGAGAEGLVEYGSTAQYGARCLHIRSFQSAPGHDVRWALFQPTLTQCGDHYLAFRGFELAPHRAMVMQEWLVFPT